MSEREPITAELRGKMDTLGWYDEDGNIVFTTGGTPVSEIACLAINSKTFGELCDAIDAVHAGLERENAELRERLAILDKRSESMHDGGSITDELRRFIEDPLLGYAPQDQHIEILTKIADRIDAEHERQLEVLYRDMSDAEWVRLPKDADGVPIHIGDVMDGTCPSGKHVNGTVNAIGDGVFWLSNVQFSLKPNYMHHYHDPTVEDVLREMLDAWGELPSNATNEAIIAEYAAKLRLVEGDAE